MCSFQVFFRKGSCVNSHERYRPDFQRSKTTLCSLSNSPCVCVCLLRVLPLQAEVVVENRVPGEKTSTSFYLIYHASVFDQREQVYGKLLWNTAVKVCGTARDTLGKEWIRSVTWSTLRLVVPFPRLLYRYANERNVTLGKHCLAVWSCCRVTLGGSTDPIGSLFLSMCVWDNFCIGSLCSENVCCWSGSRLGGPSVMHYKECRRWCSTRRCQSVLLCCFCFEWLSAVQPTILVFSLCSLYTPAHLGSLVTQRALDLSTDHGLILPRHSRWLKSADTEKQCHLSQTYQQWRQTSC